MRISPFGIFIFLLVLQSCQEKPESFSNACLSFGGKIHENYCALPGCPPGKNLHGVNRDGTLDCRETTSVSADGCTAGLVCAQELSYSNYPKKTDCTGTVTVLRKFCTAEPLNVCKGGATSLTAATGCKH